MSLKLRYHNSERNVTLKYSKTLKYDGKQRSLIGHELLAMDYIGMGQKVTHVQVAVPKPIERQTYWDKTEWVNVDFNASPGILAELIEKRLPLCNFPPSRFDRGFIDARIGEEQKPWTLFGHEEVFALKILYDSDRFKEGTGSLDEHARRLEAYMRRALERKESRLMLALDTLPPSDCPLAELGDSLSLVGKFLW